MKDTSIKLTVDLLKQLGYIYDYDRHGYVIYYHKLSFLGGHNIQIKGKTIYFYIYSTTSSSGDEKYIKIKTLDELISEFLKFAYSRGIQEGKGLKIQEIREALEI